MNHQEFTRTRCENGDITDYGKTSSATITIKLGALAPQNRHTVDATVICCGLTSFPHCHISLEFVGLHYFFPESFLLALLIRVIAARPAPPARLSCADNHTESAIKMV